MTKLVSCALLSVLLLFSGSISLGATFDERFWEKYAEILAPSPGDTDRLVGLYLEPYAFGEIQTKTPFSDVRVVTERREEVPWQIMERQPEKVRKQVPVLVRNLSQNENGETWLELQVAKPETRVNAIEIITPDLDFSRQVQVLGSQDGNSWNTIRKDGVIFDFTREEKFRHTRLTFPPSGFRYLGLKIVNGGAQPLNIKEVKIFQDRESSGQSYTLRSRIQEPESEISRQSNAIVVRMDSVFPLDRLVLTTPDRNFQRLVEIQVKQGAGDWVLWTQGVIFNFDTPSMRESDLVIEMPEISTGEFRLVFKNLDSPPLKIQSVIGQGYRRLLVFKQQGTRKLYLFWGNPAANKPQYDLAGLVAKQNLDEIPLVSLNLSQLNPKYAGNKARFPLRNGISICFTPLLCWLSPG